MRVVTFPVDAISPNYPEGWLAARHRLWRVVEARGLMVVLAQPGLSLEGVETTKKRRRAFLFNLFKVLSLENCD